MRSNVENNDLLLRTCDIVNIDGIVGRYRVEFTTTTENEFQHCRLKTLLSKTKEYNCNSTGIVDIKIGESDYKRLVVTGNREEMTKLLTKFQFNNELEYLKNLGEQSLASFDGKRYTNSTSIKSFGNL